MDEIFRKLKKAADEIASEEARPISMREALLRVVGSKEINTDHLSWSWRFHELESIKNPGSDSTAQHPA